jgi:PAS domain S-box-containing protein
MGSGQKRLLVVAALVLVGCGFGAWAGTWLRFPGTGAAILFLPYAFVTAALLRTRPRDWWLVLLAGTMGCATTHALLGVSGKFILGAETVNHLRALTLALALRRVGSAGGISSVRQVAVLLVVGAFVAPGIAALGGATLVMLLRDGDFGQAWQQWWLSNAITALTVLPLLLVDLRKRSALMPRRLLEATALAVVLISVGVWLLTSSRESARVYWAVPFLLWAAVRFGLPGISAALLGATALSIYGVVAARGPFVHGAPTENLQELQLFLLVVSLPLLPLAVLFEEQRRTAAALVTSRREYQSVVEDQTELICRYRPDGEFTFVNRAYGELFQSTSDELIGASIWQRVPAGVHPTRAELERITPSAPVATREVNVGTDAAPRWLQWRDRGLFDEQGVAVEYQSVGRDITDRKRAEDEHRELETRRSVEAVLR